MGPAVLHAYGFNGARVDASPAIDAGIRVNDCFAIRHADRIAGALLDARLTTGALRLIHFCRHVFTLSNRTQITIEKARDHNALPARLQTKIFAKKIVGRRTSVPAGKASVFQAGPGPACAVTPGSLGGFSPQTPIGSRPRVGQREGVWAISWTEPADPATIRIRAGFWACEPRAPPRPSP